MNAGRELERLQLLQFRASLRDAAEASSCASILVVSFQCERRFKKPVPKRYWLRVMKTRLDLPVHGGTFPGRRWCEIDELPSPTLQKEYATFDLPKVAEMLGLM